MPVYRVQFSGNRFMIKMSKQVLLKVYREMYSLSVCKCLLVYILAEFHNDNIIIRFKMAAIKIHV